ncbi:sensor histidine kinase [Rufibacter tibetensis]|uniref:sensor histidine kinase n=1 Tax=Rufibacter tibetensis TaxID=512763 RepID=UPI00078383BA|nr:histidine kinase [Rufibacter tibetensis]
MNLKNLPRLKVWQQALLHAFLVWFFFNLYDTGTYAYRVATEGHFLFMENGVPLTTWSRFLHANFDVGGFVLVLMPFLVEVNYHLRFKKKGVLAYVVASMLLALGLVMALIFVYWQGPASFSLRLNAMNFIAPFLLLLAYSFFYALVRYAFLQKVRQVESRGQHTQAELDALKAQLNPHFFFNTLNNLYGTALQENAVVTAQSVEQLSGIMRYVLTEAQQKITDISNEIRFLEDYLQLQQIRLPERENIRIQANLDFDGKLALIVPLLLIPFVENAFKYGISVDRDCYIRLMLEVKNQQLTLSVENLVFSDRQLDQGAGTGIAHVRKRLELLYPQQHQLEIIQNGQYKVKLQLTLN